MPENYQKTVSVALVGNPNVGKSTVFNTLTGLNQHTGNWAGKTVENAKGEFIYKSVRYIITDLPGTYSLLTHSKEEAVTRDFLCFKKPDITIIVCDATCLERNLILALQVTEITSDAILCLNLMDEAQKMKISIDTDKLSEALGIPVITTIARKKGALSKLSDALHKYSQNPEHNSVKLKYTAIVEKYSEEIANCTKNLIEDRLPLKWVGLRLLEDNRETTESILSFCRVQAEDKQKVLRKILEIRQKCDFNFSDSIASCLILTAEDICLQCVKKDNQKSRLSDKLDKFITGKKTGIPLMLLLLILILWITVTGANYPSSVLSDLFAVAEIHLYNFLSSVGLSVFLNRMMTEGVFRVTGWVISVMLPPMAIFFPLFTLLEDFGLLPRIAFNTDKFFKKSGACGKQSLSMCMSLGCNACGVTGARIIDSERERLIAIITASLMPCNGKFPTIISIIAMFLIGTAISPLSSVLSAVSLVSVLVITFIVTIFASKFLSKTFLKGEKSSFTLELPPYRTPQIGKILVRSFFDRTLKILGRAVVISIPAGLILWLLANINLDGNSILNLCTDFVDPVGQLMGLDGVILFAFILGLPANEIVVPIIIMCYTANSSLTDMAQLDMLKELFVANGWDISTAICMIIFALFHFPCSTTCLTIYKETNSKKWTFISIILPTIIGFCLCVTANLIFKTLSF